MHKNCYFKDRYAQEENLRSKSLGENREMLITSIRQLMQNDLKPFVCEQEGRNSA